jgi:hypothetical protein
MTSIGFNDISSFARERKLLKSHLMVETNRCDQFELFLSKGFIIETHLGGNRVEQRACSVMKGDSGRFEKVVMAEDFPH